MGVRNMVKSPTFVYRNVCIFGALTLTLGACSGSSSSNVTLPPTRATFDQISAANRELFDTVIDLEATPVANMPVSGQATYTGVASYKSDVSIPDDIGFPDYENLIVNEPEIVSQVRLTANFAGQTVGGTFSNFQSAELGPLDGTLTISNATITDNFFEGDVSGQIGRPGNLSAIGDGTTEGLFLGGSAEYVAGYIGMDTDLTQGGRMYGVYAGRK